MDSGQWRGQWTAGSRGQLAVEGTAERERKRQTSGSEHQSPDSREEADSDDGRLAVVSRVSDSHPAVVRIPLQLTPRAAAAAAARSARPATRSTNSHGWWSQSFHRRRDRVEQKRFRTTRPAFKCRPSTAVLSALAQKHGKSAARICASIWAACALN